MAKYLTLHCVVVKVESGSVTLQSSRALWIWILTLYKHNVLTEMNEEAVFLYFFLHSANVCMKTSSTLSCHMYILSVKPNIVVLTCLNCTMMSFESSISLNIPSSLLVNAAPHSEETSQKPQVDVCSGSRFSFSHLSHTECVCVCREVMD